VTLSRRAFVLGASAAGAALGGCDNAFNALSRRLSGGLPAAYARPETDSTDPDFLLLQRTSFGPAPGDLDRLRGKGRDAYLDEQLHPERIDDFPCELLVEHRFESLHMSPGDLFEFHRHVAEDEIARATILRAVYSRRQLFEVLVEFWTDHFNIFHGKGDCAWLKTADDRDVIRRHALGRFRDLLRASALSPAMLVYLDGQSNRKGKPNENYARELLELHTLGVHGGYTQKDVMEVARCLTGWDLNDGWARARVEFLADRHDDGEKTVLGQRVPAGGGRADLDRVVDLVARHPSTARHLALKICRRFVADDPPEALVGRVAAKFAATDGDLRETVRESLSGLDAAAPRFKRPFRFVVSALRGLGATTQGKEGLRRYLQLMGQAPFQYPTPDGFPDDPEPWLGTMLWRWNFALKLASDRVPDAHVDIPADDPGGLFAHLVGRKPGEAERAALAKAADRKESLALALASPAFQWY
jgi:uncharacterized protein (DUF1800 family)